MFHKSVDSTTTLLHQGESFVDNTCLGCTIMSPDSAHPQQDIQEYEKFQSSVSNLSTLAQHWERLLYTTGGMLHLKKSFWFSLSWQWKIGITSLATISQHPGTIKLTSGAIPDPEIVPRIEPTATYCTLGVHISPAGTTTESFHILKELTVAYASVIIGSQLSKEEAYWSYIL